MPLTHSSDELAALERRMAHDLACLNYPPENWLPAKTGPDGRPMTDILIVGAGMHGQATAFALLQEGLRNIRVIDRNAPGSEGPWGTFARMPALRSPRQVNGLDLGIPSLTFRAWFEAQHGGRAWDDLYKIGRLDWRDYLLWVRKVADIPVGNGVQARTITPAEDHVGVELERDSRSSVLYARAWFWRCGAKAAVAPISRHSLPTAGKTPNRIHAYSTPATPPISERSRQARTPARCTSGAIDLWRNDVSTQATNRNREAARFPYLSPLQEASAGFTPRLDCIHHFSWGGTMSQGVLSDAIVRRLFTEEASAYYDAMRGSEDPELAPTSFFVPRDQRITQR